MGAENRQYQQFVKEINDKKMQIDTEHNAAVNQLNAARDQAINSAQREFTAAITKLAGDKATAESQKGTARLAALQDLRNKVYTINQQTTQFNQQLAAIKAQQQQALNNVNVNDYLKTNLQTTTQLGNAVQPSATQTQDVGQIAGTEQPWWEKINQPVPQQNVLGGY